MKFFGMLVLWCLLVPQMLWAQEVTLDWETDRQRLFEERLSALAAEEKAWISTSTQAIGPVLTQDSLALVAFYNATNGPTWSRNTNWLSGPVPTWYGVTVSGNRVVRIHLFGNLMSGSLPSAIGDLTALTYFGIFANRLSGPIPSEIGNLTALTRLDLGGNRFSGSIPPEIGNLTQLTELDLASNNLTGSLPPEIGNLVLLTKLDAHSNELTGAIPSTIGNLTQVTYLSLSLNQLSGSLPSEMGNMSALFYLSIDGNQLSGAIPPEMGNLANLYSLSLPNNQLTSLPAEIGNLTSLRSLWLSNNQLTSIPSTLGNLPHIQSIFLQSNQLSGSIPPELGNLVTLTTLNLQKNQLSGSIPPELGNLTSLEELRLQKNQLSGPIPSELGNLSNLSRLDLSENLLDGSLPSTLGNIPGLRNIFINDNALSGPLPAELTQISQVKNLAFQNTQLCEPQDATFQAWLKSITNLTSSGISCATSSFLITLTKRFFQPNGKKVAKIKWNPVEVNKGKVDIYVGESPDGTFLRRTVNDGVDKVKLGNAFPGNGPYTIQVCEKNSTTVCSNVLSVDWTGALVDLMEEDGQESEEGGKGAAEVPEAFMLQSNYPNPFNPQTTIRFDVPLSSRVKLAVYDLLGREVRVLVEGTLAAGTHEATFEANSLPSGLYLYRLETQEGTFQKVMHLVK